MLRGLPGRVAGIGQQAMRFPLGVILMHRPGQAASPMEYWAARGW